MQSKRPWTSSGISERPSHKATLHRAYYERLRGRGFRAHHVSEIYKRAREVVRATKGNAGSRPLLKKLTARIRPLDYKVVELGGVTTSRDVIASQVRG